MHLKNAALQLEGVVVPKQPKPGDLGRFTVGLALFVEHCPVGIERELLVVSEVLLLMKHLCLITSKNWNL